MRLNLKKSLMKKEIKESELSNIMSVASVGVATLEMLEEILPSTAKDVEKAATELIESFNILLDKVDTKDEKVAEAVQKMRISMQFQDRNTQMIENAVSLLKRYRGLLGGVHEFASGHIEHADISEPAEKILSGIKMSIIRTKFMEVLAKASIPFKGTAIQCVGEQKESGEVELF